MHANNQFSLERLTDISVNKRLNFTQFHMRACLFLLHPHFYSLSLNLSRKNPKTSVLIYQRPKLKRRQCHTCKNNNATPTGSPASDKKKPSEKATLLFCQASREKMERRRKWEQHSRKKQTEQVLTQIDAGKALKTHHWNAWVCLLSCQGAG